MSVLNKFSKLVFSKSVLKSGRGTTNFWLRSNSFGCLYFIVIFPTIFTFIVGATGILKEQDKDHFSRTGLVTFYLVAFVLVYRIIMAIVRYNKTKIPIWSYIRHQSVNTPFAKLNIAMWLLQIVPTATVVDYRPMSADEIALNRRQQQSKLLFHSVLLVVTTIVAKLTI